MIREIIQNVVSEQDCMVRAGLLVRRSVDDEGPFYRQWPEGLIHEWDGRVENIKVLRILSRNGIFFGAMMD